MVDTDTNLDVHEALSAFIMSGGKICLYITDIVSTIQSYFFYAENDKEGMIELKTTQRTDAPKERDLHGEKYIENIEPPTTAIEQQLTNPIKK